VDKVNYTIKGERKFDTLTDMYIALVWTGMSLTKRLADAKELLLYRHLQQAEFAFCGD
jgi:hypothetical protein